jgi:predicted RNA-binding Zn ribbon-like protein
MVMDNEGAVEPLLAFVNTVDFEAERDRLDAWLRDRGLAASAAEVEWTAAVREALRALLLDHNAVAADVAGAAATLERASRRARLELRVGDGGPALEPGVGGLDGELGRLLAIAVAAAADGTWMRLKACRSATCRWAFYDAARNRSRTWCSMAVCGNRAKARAYRERH